MTHVPAPDDRRLDPTRASRSPASGRAGRTGRAAGEDHAHVRPGGEVDPDPTTTAGVLAGVGPRLRALRQGRGLTLAELSTRTDVSVSTLSRLESGQRRPALELLLPLSRAFGVPLDDLVGAPATGDPRIHLKPVRRHGQTIVPLSRGGVGVQAFKHVIGPGSPRVHPEPRVHEGFEWLYVLRGRLRLVLGERDMVLEAGEVVEFDTRTPHWFGGTGEGVVEVLSLFDRQGERLHVRSADEGGHGTADEDGAPDADGTADEDGAPDADGTADENGAPDADGTADADGVADSDGAR